MPRTFISYSRRDAVFANKLATSLTELGVEVWIDTQDIQPGMKWSKAVQQGLDASETMLVIVSPDSMDSTNVEDEWQYYLDQGKQVIPLVWRPAKLHFQLNRFQYIDFSEQSFDAAFARLLSSLGIAAPEMLISGKRAYDVLARHYDDWIGLEKHDSQLLTTNSLNVILERSGNTTITADLMEYLLCSAAQIRTREGNRQTNPHLKRWFDEINLPVIRNALNRVLQNNDVSIRQGMLNLLKDLDIRSATDLVSAILESESEIEVLRIAVNTLSHLATPLSQAQAKHLFEKYDDWIIRSFALKSYKQNKTALLFSDGTDFAETLGQLAQSAGYSLITVKLDFLASLFLQLNDLDIDLFAVYDLIILVRGEHFSDIGGETLYPMLQEVIERGSILFGTAWIGWETKGTDFADILPFQYIDFKENVNIKCQPTNDELSETIFSGSLEFMTSYEICSTREATVTLLQTTTGVPVFGYRLAGQGACYYLNSCEHSCLKPFPSPLLVSSDLRESISRMFNLIAKNSEA